MRIIPNKSEKRFVSCLMKCGQKPIRLNPINSETSIQMNPNQSETKFSIQLNPDQSESIRMNPRLEWFELILRENSVWINPRSNWFGLTWIENFFRIGSDLFGLIRIGFRPFFIKRDTKRFSDLFGMNSDTYIGMNRNISDWLGMNFNPINKNKFYALIYFIFYF